MADVNSKVLIIHRVTELPEVLTAHSLYIVKRIQFGLAEMVFTDAEGQPLKVLDTAAVQTMISVGLTSTSSLVIVDTIAERDELVFAGDSAVYVVDATGDPEVLTGSALYFYKKETNTFVLIICAKHTSWSDVLGKPVSTPDQIDEAVEKMHIHENNEVLSNLTEGEDGTLYYKGAPVSDIRMATIDW